MNRLATVLTDPTWFPHRYDARTGTMRFLRLTRDTHRAATFLDDESLRAVAERVDLPDPHWTTAEHAPAGPLHFVFHSAFCCSTLLARALDVPGRSMGLKEPVVLNDLTGAKRAGVPAPRFTTLLDRTLSLLARPLSPGEVTVVKPGNVANDLLDACLQLRPTSRAILMYSRLPVFLRSVADKGLWGRQWARGLYRHLRPVSAMNPGYDDAELFAQTDLQIAALAWLMHQAQFADVLRRHGSSRVRSLDGDLLVERPRETLLALDGFLELGWTAGTVAGIVGGPAFREHSKSHDAGFGAGGREQRHARANAAHGEEIGMVVHWAEAVAKHCGVPMTHELALPGANV